MNNAFIANGIKDAVLGVFLENNKVEEDIVRAAHKFIKSKKIGLSLISDNVTSPVTLNKGRARSSSDPR